ncbi:MAG: type II secretion system secretin GspD [Sideroxydans sp.]|jgi:general secretion pathway protein D
MKKDTPSPLFFFLLVLLCTLPISASSEVGSLDDGARVAAPDANQANFDFVNAEITSVIKAIGVYSDVTFIIDPRVKGTLSLASEKPLSKVQALQLLNTVLRMQGYAVVSGNGYSKVVPEADAKLQGGMAVSSSAGGNQITTQIFHLKHEAAATLVPVLRPLISPNNIINANPGNNTLVITDYADNLARLSRIIAALDGPANTSLEVIPLQHAIANDIAAMVNRLMQQTTGAIPDSGHTVLSDSRTNTVIVSTSSAARTNLAKSLIAKLDQPTTQPGNVHVVYLKNAEAIKLALTLRAVMAADTSSPAPTSTSPQAAAQSQLPTGSAGGFIQADPSTNTLIITASEPVYRNLRGIISQLDARRAQVYIEALIVEVDASKLAEFGVQWGALGGGVNGSGGAATAFSTGGNNLANQAAANLAPGGVPLTPGNGLSLGFFSSKMGMGALLHALESDSKTNILSMPNLVTLDNEEAKIMVGQNVPFITGQYTTPASAGAAGVNPFQTVERKDIGLTLKVKPQISQGGTVKMAIYQETSSISPTVNAAGLITSKRSIDTNVLVDDGQIVVLGGLIDDNVQDNEEQVPGLGSIPLLGNLFKYRSRTHNKTNLMVFLRPTVIRSDEQGSDLAADRYNYIRTAEITNQPEDTALMPSMEAPLLPELKGGKLIDGPLSHPGMKLSPTLSAPSADVEAIPPAASATAE